VAVDVVSGSPVGEGANRGHGSVRDVAADVDDWLDALRDAGLSNREHARSWPLPASSPAVRCLVEDAWAAPTAVVRPGHLALRSWAPSTIDAYNEDWCWFAAWCHASTGLRDPFHADELVVAGYVAAMVGDRLAFATIRRRLAAIAFAFDVARRPSPTRSRLVRRVLKGAARTLGTTQRRAEPLTLAQLRKIVDLLVIARPGQLPEVAQRDQLLLALGWAAALRPGELVALDVEDVTFTGDTDSGEGGMVVRIRHSKASRHRTDHVAVPCARRAATCPVRLAERAAGLTLLGGPLFCHVDRHGNIRGRLAANAVARLVRAAVADVLGLDPTPYSGRSLRAGYVTEARRRRVPAHLIARHTRHHSIQMLDTYHRPDELLVPAAFGAWW
jgi:integrase